ncbi:hypothetical protein ACC685_36440, partial [Rhizobium ruizarguesonis]
EVVLPNHSESYQLPLAVAWDDAHPSSLAQQLALGRIRQGRRVGFLTDGFAVEAMARGILHGLRDRSRTTGRTGSSLEISRLSSCSVPMNSSVP